MTDYTVGDTVHFLFTTRRFSTGAPFALAGTPAVSAYENESLTQITAGITLGVDHDTVTGLNLVTVVASGANGFEAGKDYHLVITTGTVDSVSVVGEVVGRFTLSRSAAAVDLANATDGLSALKTLIDTIDDFLDTEIAAILTDTGTDIPATLATIAGYLDTEIGQLGTDVAAVKSDTAAILLDTGTDGVVVNAAGLATDAVNEIADGILNRDMSTGTDSGSPTVRTMRQALRFLRNKWSISGTTLTVTKEDDTTASWTSTLAGTAGADPITSSDPA